MVFERGSTVGGNDLAGKDLGIGGIVSILEDRGLKVLYLDDIFKKLNADLEKKALQLSLDGAMQVMLQDPTQNWQQMLPYYFANETLQGILEGKSCRDLFPGYDVLVVSEPTYIGIGKLIREEFINNDQAQLYRVLTQALAYAFDRTVLNKAIVEPA